MVKTVRQLLEKIKEALISALPITIYGKVVELRGKF